MKKRSLLLGLISLFLAFSANAQIVTKYQQGFETGEPVSYQVTSGSASPITSLYSSGSRSLKMQHGATETIVLLDTLDFTDNASYTAYYLEFMHICDVDPLTCASATDVAIIEVMHPGESNWHTLTDQDCDFTWGGGSTHFRDYSSYSQRAYDQWMGSATSNTWWKRERFRLANRINDVSDLSQRKLLVRFRLKPRTAAGATNSGWYLDNITVKCSPESMALPVAKMIAYPDAMSYPCSRATRIEVDLTTSVAAGMCNDSVYIDYQLGRLAPIRRMTMTPVPGHAGRYRSFIPFCGYDTVVYWRMVAMDNTVNHNKTTFPLDESGWQQYKSVRGVEAFQELGIWNTDQSSLPSSNIFPFPNKGLHKSQMSYSQAELQAAGYGPGAITQIRFPARSSVVNSNHQRFVVEMRNIPNDYALHVDNKFNTEYHRTVYDSSLSITQNSGTFGIINFQDTFYYAGDGLMVTITSKNTTQNPAALSVSTYTFPGNTLGTLYKNYDYNLGSDFDPFNSAYFMNGGREAQRPSFMFNANKNMPLLYDCGISGFVTPNDSVTANAVGNNDVTVTLKNYGAQPINAVRIYYSVDNGSAQYYDWTGTLAGGASTSVTINTTQTYSAGYHEMLAWVDDSVTTAGMRYRDHEPLNDTLWTRFVACDGPMSGTRYVGGSTPDYQSLEKFLYAVSLCGINGPLTVKLAPGTYRPVVFPSIPGTSASNYVLFEPSNNTGNNSVIFEALNDANTTITPYLVNLQQANHIRFNRITFNSSVSVSNAANYQVRLGINSTGCQFNDCNFLEGGNNANLSYTVATALLYSGGCDSLTVTNCQFSRGRAGISLVGPAVDNMAHGSYIYGNKFLHHGVNGVIIRNQVGTVVDSNSFDDVYANSSYVILLQDCAGPTKVTRNTVYVTSGASCLGATGFNGYATDNALIANNMLVSNDDGTSNMLTTPLNIINAEYTRVLNNSIKLVAPTRSGIAAATFGGTAINNSMFYNNIVACFDTVNFAFNYIPSTNATNYIGYNIYYTRGPILNKYDGINCLALSNWQGHYPSDANSLQVDPAYLNSTNTDLRSYSQNVKGHGMHFDQVTDDIYGTERDSVAPCIGAFEFSALPYDFEVIEFIEPFDAYCDAPSAAPIKVVIKNSGINAYDPANQTIPLQLSYSRTATPGSMVPGFSGMVSVNRVIPATDTIIFNTGVTLPFLPNGLNDSTYHLTVWLSSQIDPNPANDTSSTTVTARYHAPAPSNVQVNASYGVNTPVTANGGLQTWYSNVYTSSTSHQSEVYWFTSPTSTEPIWRGQTYVTDPLYTDTTFYIRQKRDYPLVKISEVQLKNNMPGVTYPMPLWMNGSTAMAVELTNVGDYPANLKDDSIYTVSGTSSLNNKFYKFPDVTIQPGQTIVLQYRSSISVDSAVTLGTATISPQLTANFAIIYKSKGVIMDAVAFNGVTTQNQWNNAQVPNYVWAGEGITIPDTVQTAGVIRTGWPTGGTPSNSRQYWSLAGDNNKMTLGTTNSNLIRFVDNGCEGDVATVHIHLINLPDVDLVVDSLDVASGCGLGIDTLSVMVYNRGALPSNQVVIHYEAVSNPLFPGQSIALQTCSDTIANIPGAATSLLHTFSTPLDFTVSQGSVNFSLRVWVEKNTNDNTNFNDTSYAEFVSSFTPGIPNVYGYDTVNYGGRAVLQAIATNDSLAWYDSNMQPLDTTNVFVSDYLYADDTFYVTSFGTRENLLHVGQLASLNSATAYPSPYNPNKKFIKEQYLFTAQDLINAGHGAGPINSVSFYLDTIVASAGTMTFTDYVVSMGTTTNDIFANNHDWQPVTTFSTIDTLTLSNSTRGWIKHVFDSVFVWDGTSNIVVQVTRAIDPNITQGARTRYTAAGNNKVLYKNGTTSLVNSNDNGSRSPNRPDIRFGFVDFGCEGPAKPVYVTIVGMPPADAALSLPDGNDTVTYSSCGNINIDMKLSNFGTAPISAYTVNYWIDGVAGSYAGSSSVASHQSATVTIAQPSLTPGRHFIKAVVSVAGDTVPTNDTVTNLINVRFCAGTYTIGSTGLFPDFTTAIDTLVNAGIDGPVVFSVQNGTYQEQLSLGAVDGSSATNTITFRSASRNSDDVILRHTPANGSNYVLSIDGASFVAFEHITLYSTGATYSNVVDVANSRNIHFTGDVIRVKGTVNNTNGNGVIIGEGVNFLYIDSCVIDSGYCGVRSTVSAMGLTEGVFINNNSIQNFLSQGIALRKVNDVYVVHNQVRSGVNINNRSLTGIFIAEHNGPVSVERNNVVLSDNRSGGKQCIKLVNINGSNATRSHVYNNMAASYGSATAGQTSCGIWIDSSSWINVYYNTCQVYAGLTNAAAGTRAFSVETTSSGIYAMNNLFSNISRGYAFYVKQAANIGNTNYNNYWTNSSSRLAFWSGTECASFEELQAADGMDVNSVHKQTYFISNEDLHLSVGTFCELAQYNTEVPVDIDDTIRPQIPNPCMGAHEFQRSTHNVAVLDVLEPTIDIELGVTDNIEGDPLKVKVKLMNDGTSTENNVVWWAEILNASPALTSPQRTIEEIMPQEEVYDSTVINMPIGIIDTQYVVIHLELLNDAVPENNTLVAPFFLDPAFNIKTDSVTVFKGDGCRKQETPVSVNFKNVGRKPIAAGTVVSIGFQAVLGTTGVTVSTLPVQWVENATIPYDIEVNASGTLNFTTMANLYPTGIHKDINVRCRAWATHPHDQKPLNDTSTFITVPSKFTPEAPVGINLQIPYATWDTIFASETNQDPVNNNDIHRPIRWHRDSTDVPFYSPNNYATSCWWETPQYFHDSTYYLSCISNSGCTSYYSPVHVMLNPRVPVDMAVLNVVEPQPRMVYMLDDSVKISLINYGSQPVSNIPVVYQLFSPTNVLLQEVREICPVTIQPDQVYVYKFDSLIHIPQWSYNSYRIRTWTDMTNENVRLNDTLRGGYQFQAVPDNEYTIAGISAKTGLDITRVAFSSLDNNIAPVGFTYLNFVNATNSTANIGLGDMVLTEAGAIATPSLIYDGVQDYGGSVSMQGVGQLRALHVVKGTNDTMIVECANTDRSNDYSTGGWLTVFIDQDRDGFFSFFPEEIGDSLNYSYPYTEIVYHDSIKSNTPLRFPFTIPETMRTGYTRMRVMLNQAAVHPTSSYKTMQFGQVQDYLLYVEDRPTDVDICAARIDSPTSQFIGGHTGLGGDTAVTVRFRMANKGALAINSAVITYQFIHPDYNEGAQTLQWAGTLDKGASVSVALPPHVFPVGTTELMIVVSAAGDTNATNDTLIYQFHRSKVLTLIYREQFEEQDIWFAPRGNSAYTQNVWQRGYPQKVNIMACVSDSNVWATNLNGYINTYQTGTRSILYTPIIDISTIKADTMTIWVATDMPEGHLLNIEYCDYLGRWNVMGSANDSNWYNVAGGWGDVSSGYGYSQFSFPISKVSGNFQQYVQFRFIYSATTESQACDGAAFDDLIIGRQRRNIDASVVDIIYPTEPRFGQIINPTVILYNHGYDTLYNVPLAYMPYGSFLPKTGTFEGVLLPRGTATYTFPTPFVVMNDFPDTFTICSFTTINMDMYRDNDTVCKEFYLTPLDNDMAMVSFLSPMQRVIAGDSIQVSTRLRNYGQAPVQSAQVTYVINEDFSVTETIDFEEALGHPLGSFEYFNYTFHDKFRATMGLMNLTAYVAMANDDYLFNDTIILDLNGISAITDLQATDIVVDTSDHYYTVIQLTIDNVGARAVSDFDAGFWYYNDTNRIVKAHIHLDPPLAALSRLYYRFDTLLPHHAELYRNVVAYVHVDGDNDMSNDTTTRIVTQTFDMMAVQVEVEENREEDCNVRLRIENIGNRVFANSMDIFATINGTSIRRMQIRPVVPPGETFVFTFPDKVPKSPTRTYSGYGRVVCQGDKNPDNNETSDIVVLNYFEPDGIPVAPSKNGMVLQQNYPNPFNNTTRIDFFLPFSGHVSFFVMDEMGRLVFQRNDSYSAGDHSIDFNDASLPSGVYYYGIEMNGERLMRKMVLKR